MEILLDPEEKIMCPYNPAHHIRRCRMSTHLTKCKKNYPKSKLVECDFNVNHKICEPKLQYHHENCPDRRKIEVMIYQEEGADTNKYPVHNIEVPTEESWDDLNVPTYDPQKYCESKDILQHIDVESPAKRNNFRIANRQRLGQFVGNRPLMQVQEIANQNANRNAVALKRNLPDMPSLTVEEDTPETVAKLVERLKIGRNKAFLPILV